MLQPAMAPMEPMYVSLSGLCDVPPPGLARTPWPQERRICTPSFAGPSEVALALPAGRWCTGAENAPRGRRDGCKGAKGTAACWWRKPEVSLSCPLTGFPISWLPYPPFKLRVDPHRSSPHKLADGKYLVVQIIATGSFVACGRELLASDIQALDDYVQKCKLGPHRPGKFLALLQEADNPATQPARRVQVRQEIEKMSAIAQFEWARLRRIQENRLQQLGSEAGAPSLERREHLNSSSTREPSTDADDFQ